MITKKILMILTLSCSMVGSSLGLTLDKIPDTRLDVTAFCCDSSETRLFVGLANASLWLSNDGGTTWESLTQRICPSDPLFFVENMFALDVNADTVFCRTWNGASSGWQYTVTTDGGLSWRKIEFNQAGNYGHRLVVDRTNHSRILSITPFYFYYSEDFGYTWQSRVYDEYGNQRSTLIQHPDSSNIFYITGYGISDGGILKSENYGNTWFSIGNTADLMEMDLVYATDLDVLSDGRIIVCPSDGTNYSPHLTEEFNRLIFSDTSGSSWEVNDVGLPVDFRPTILFESIDNDGVLFVVGLSNSFQLCHGLYKSIDYGDSFERVENNFPTKDNRINNLYQNTFNGNIYALTHSDGVIKAENAGETWEKMELNLSLGNAVEFSITGDQLYYRTYKSNDRISCFDIHNNQYLDLGYPAVSGDTSLIMNENVIDNGDEILVLYHKYSYDQSLSSLHISRSSDFGIEWNDVCSPLIEPFTFRQKDFIYNSSNVTRIINLIDVDGHTQVNTTIDTGRNWITTNLSSPYSALRKAISQTDETIFLALRNEGIFRSNDNGITWLNMEFPDPDDLATNFVYLIADENNNNLYVFGNYRFWQWNGQEWIDQGSSLSAAGNMTEICLINEEEQSFIATNWANNFLWYRSDPSARWERIEVQADFIDDSCNLVYPRYDAERERIWVSNQLGLYWFDIAQLGVKDQPIQLYPAGYEVLTTYPNPFNASTKIEFILEKTNDVSLKLYDINGRLVRKLLDEKRETGKHTLTLDGSQLASGTYFLRLDDGQQVHSRKLLLVK